MCPYMFDEIRFIIYTTIIAKVTFKRFSNSMCSNMFVQILFIHPTKIMSHVWKVFHQCDLLYVFQTSTLAYYKDKICTHTVSFSFLSLTNSKNTKKYEKSNY